MISRIVLAFAVLAMVALQPLAAQQPQNDALAEPYRIQREAYAARDPDMAASAYTADARLIYRYEGAPEEVYDGAAAIRTSFAAFFGQVDESLPLDINFRIENSALSIDGEPVERGLYRLRFGTVEDSFGAFQTRLVQTENGYRFASDLGTDATRDMYEAIPGAVLLDAAEQDLDRRYCRGLTGRYRGADGCTQIVTMSVARLMVRDGCSQQWRGLYRQSGREWRGGETVLSDEQDRTYRFAPPLPDSSGIGQSPALSIVSADGVETVAERNDAYQIETITFESDDGTTLAGDVYLPEGADHAPGIVLVHGSGPQDRDGYASIMAVLADALAARGFAVLSYDKRGVGESGGDWSRAGFDLLGSDATAAMRALANHNLVDADRIGLAGSSQAGWVVAQAIADGAAPTNVFLLGAAGSALTVEEQNLFNSGVRMRCAGLSEPQIATALDQQRAFFAAVADPAMAAELDRVTAQAAADPGLVDWLFPDSRGIDRDAGDWYMTLALRFDPLPVWRDYRGDAMFVLSAFDDSTPTEIAASQLRGAGLGDQIRILEDAQHLGLATQDVCHGDLSDLSRFAPALFDAIDAFARHNAN